MSVSSYPMPVVLLLALLSQQALAADDENKGEETAKEPPPCKYCPDYSGWSGWVEGGLGIQSDDDYHFGRYTGHEDKGAELDGSGELHYRGEDGSFLEGEVEDLVLESRRVTLEGGKQGQYEIGVEYDQIPNFRERGAYSPFRDLGGGRIGLPADWVSGPTTATADMPSLGNDVARTPLETERDRTGARFALHPSRQWEVSGYARREKKDGVKDLGATVDFDQTVILPVPFEYQTNEFGMTLGYTSEKLQSQLSYTASLFKNDQESITWRNPFEASASNTAWGQMAEAPDNEFHQISAILGYQLREDTRIGAKFARGRMTQDQSFLPYTSNPSVATSALPASSLDGQVDTTLAAVEVNYRPVPKLRVDGSYTYSNRDNNTDVNVYDYVVTDLGAGGERKNRPYSFEQRLLRLKAAYRFPKNVNLSAGYDDDQMDRTYVAAEETHDKTVWAKLKLHPLDTLETTLKYSYADRSASDYVALSSIDPLLDTPNSNFYNNPLMRILNLADRKRSKAGFEIAYSPLSALSLGFDLDYLKDDYSGGYLGLQEAKGLTYTASASYTFSEALAATAYYTHDKLSSDQKGSEKLLAISPDDLWIAADENLTDTVGLGVTWAAIPEKLDVGADLTYADFTGKMEFAGAPSLPEIGSTLRAFKLHGTYRLDEKLSLRAEYRYEQYEEDDWSKDGVVNTLPTLLSLGIAPQDTSTSLGFVSLRYEF